MGQLHEIESDLLDLGYQIIAVSADSPSKLSETIDKHGMKYHLFSDSKMAASRAFNIAYKLSDDMLERYESYGIDLEAASGESHHMLPVPGVFLVGPDGKITFSYVNPDHTVRLAPEILLSAAQVLVQ